MRSIAILAASAAVAISSVAFAGFTKIGAAPASEPSQHSIINTLYGGGFHKIGDDFFNGAVTLRRVDDAMSVTPSMNIARGTIGDTTDASVIEGRFTARAVAKFSNNSQSLSIDRGGSVSHLFDVTGYGYDVSSTTAHGKCMGEMMTFTRSGDSGTHSSDMTRNADGRDHMITYEVLGLGTKEKTWLMFWEDLDFSPSLPKRRTHSDYNDLVVEIRATAVPLPAAVWAGGALLGTAGVFRKRLKRAVGM